MTEQLFGVRWCRSACIRLFVLLVAAGCGEETPPYTRIPPGVGGSGGTGGQGSGAGTGGQGGQPDDSGLSDGVTSGVFDPKRVYVLGTVREGACESGAIIHWSNPNVASAGYHCHWLNEKARVRADGTLLLTNRQEVREFHCDDCPGWSPDDPYPSDYLDNDTPLNTPPCGGNVADFAVGIDGEVIYKCASDWYDAAATLLPLTNPIFKSTLYGLGHDNKALGGVTDAYSIGDLTDGTTIDVTGLPPGTIITARVSGPDSFWVAYWNNDSETVQRWTIPHSGIATLDGDFPEPPASVSGSGGTSRLSYDRLDGNGDLFSVGRVGVDYDVIVRRTIAGAADIVYTEADEPAVKLHAGRLFTGP